MPPVPEPLEVHDSRNELAAFACVDSGDWDVLFRAVQYRLRRAFDNAADMAPAPPAQATAQVAVMECVEALEQLHRMLADARRVGGPDAAAAGAEESTVQALLRTGAEP